MKNLLINQKGVSLVQVMMAFGLMSVLGLAVMRMNETNMKESKRVELKGELDNVHREVMSYLSNDVACSYTLGGVGTNLSSLKTTGTMSISSVKDVNNNNKFTDTFNRMGVKITDFQFVNFNSADNTATLNIQYQYRVGKKNLNRTRPVTVNFEFDDANPDNLKRCLARGGVTNIDPKQICDLVVGLDSGGDSYFDGATCNFPRASCERTGGIWNGIDNFCEPGDAQKLKIRQQACEAEGGFLTKVVKAWHYKLSNHMDDTQPCTINDLDQNECYCKTKWTKYYDKDVVSGSFPQEKITPLLRMQQVGGYFTIQEQIPANVGPNKTGATDKKRYTRIRVNTTFQYLLPDIEYTPPTFTTNPYMIENAGTPFILVEFRINCYSPNATPPSVSGSPWGWEEKPNLSNSGWSWSQGGSSYTNSYSRFNGYGIGSFGIATDYRSQEGKLYRIYAAQKQSGGYIDWRNQYSMTTEVYGSLEPGDKCVATVRPVYSSEHSKSSFNLRFSTIQVLVDQYTNLMDHPISDG